MARYNYKHDIPPIRIRLVSAEPEGAVVKLASDADFILRFYVEGYEGRHYDCSRIGGKMTNCEVSDDGEWITCYLNNCRLGIGPLSAEVHYIKADAHYADGDQHSVVIVDSDALDIELVEGNGDVTVSKIDATLPFVYRTAYDIAVAHGYTGGAEAFYHALASVVDIETAEAERVANELERIAAEVARQDAERRRAEEFEKQKLEFDKKADRSNDEQTIIAQDMIAKYVTAKWSLGDGEGHSYRLKHANADADYTLATTEDVDTKADRDNREQTITTKHLNVETIALPHEQLRDGLEDGVERLYYNDDRILVEGDIDGKADRSELANKADRSDGRQTILAGNVVARTITIADTPDFSSLNANLNELYFRNNKVVTEANLDGTRTIRALKAGVDNKADRSDAEQQITAGIVNANEVHAKRFMGIANHNLTINEEGEDAKLMLDGKAITADVSDKADRDNGDQVIIAGSVEADSVYSQDMIVGGKHIRATKHGIDIPDPMTANHIALNAITINSHMLDDDDHRLMLDGEAIVTEPDLEEKADLNNSTQAIVAGRVTAPYITASNLYFEQADLHDAIVDDQERLIYNGEYVVTENDLGALAKKTDLDAKADVSNGEQHFYTGSLYTHEIGCDGTTTSLFNTSYGVGIMDMRYAENAREALAKMPQPLHEEESNYLLMVDEEGELTVEDFGKGESKRFAFKGDLPPVVQSLGDSPDAVMSQKAVSDAVENFGLWVDERIDSQKDEWRLVAHVTAEKPVWSFEFTELDASEVVFYLYMNNVDEPSSYWALNINGKQVSTFTQKMPGIGSKGAFMADMRMFGNHLLINTRATDMYKNTTVPFIGGYFTTEGLPYKMTVEEAIIDYGEKIDKVLIKVNDYAHNFDDGTEVFIWAKKKK